MNAPLVSVVITGYARPELLRATVESLRRVSSYPNLEWILADDGSPPEQQQGMRALPFDRVVLAETNRGLGANTNAGLAAARGEYVLQLQDDWVCSGPAGFIEAGVRLLQARDDIGIVRFMAPETHVPYESFEAPDGSAARLYPPQPASRWWVYSDWPHLKSRAFIEFIGPYQESRSMQRTETDMRDRFNGQDRYALAYLEGYEMFEHVGEAASHRRPTLRARLGGWLRRLPLLDRVRGGEGRKG